MENTARNRENGQRDIDEMTALFEAYKIRRRKEQLEFERELKELNLDADFETLNTGMESLRKGLQILESLKEEHQQKQRELNAIEPAPPEKAACSQQNDKDKEPQLVVGSGVSQCVYEGCQRMVDNQLLLLHYLCDHNQPDSYCLSLVEGERVVLSFQPQSCAFRVNKVLGLLAYGGPLEQQFALTRCRRTIYNAFLPDQHSHLASHIPVVVLICRTAAHAGHESKNLRRGERWLSDCQQDAFFVIWLVTPSDQLMNATLCLCGRDAAVRAAAVIGVRQVSHCQDTGRFMAVDSNYWRLPYSEIEKISNKFRDELHLEIGITEPRPSN